MNYDDWKLDTPPHYDEQPDPLELLEEAVRESEILSEACETASRATGDLAEADILTSTSAEEGLVVGAQIMFDLFLDRGDDMEDLKRSFAKLLRAIADGLQT